MSDRAIVIKLICEFPLKLYEDQEAYYSGKGISIKEYKKKVVNGLKSLKKNIRIDEIIDYLKKNQEIIKKWDLYSIDKRSKRGYYFMINKRNYEFGYYDKVKNDVNQIFLSEHVEYPCALFIIYELEITKYFYL